MELDELLQKLHGDHDCKPGKCACICGCDVQLGCTVLFGSLCSVCYVRELRDEGDGPHGYPEEVARGG